MPVVVPLPSVRRVVFAGRLVFDEVRRFVEELVRPIVEESV